MTSKNTLLLMMGLLIVGNLLSAGCTQTATPVKTPATTTPVVTTTAPSIDGMANPASVNCGKVGATSVILNNPDGSQYGMCKFPNGTACEEWALFRGEGCKPNVAPIATQIK